MIHYNQCSALNKCCDDSARYLPHFNEARSLKGENIYFQIILWSDAPHPEEVKCIDCSETFNEIYLMKPVAVSFSNYDDDPDPHYITGSPAMIPDYLIPLSTGDTIVVGNEPTLLWVTARGRFTGEYVVSYQFITAEQSLSTAFLLKVLDIHLPKERCALSARISVSSIAAGENIPPFCNVFWDRLFDHFKFAFKQEITDIITPLFASEESLLSGCNPDQLIKVKVNKNKYEYNYDALDSWLLAAKQDNIKNFTFTALFPSFITQKCPRVYAEEYRGRYLLFSEEDEITSDRYLSFLNDFLRKLIRHLKELNLSENVTFVMTNEIAPEYADVYNECFGRIKRVLSSRKIVGYSRGSDVADLPGFSAPILPISAIDPYSSDSPTAKISFDPHDSKGFMNQLIAAPSIRIKTLGLFCYLHRLDEIILDYYNCTVSPSTGKPFDPFVSPDACKTYPAGSLFWIYNHADGPYVSVRMMYLRSAMQDLAALRRLENFVSRERIISMIKSEVPMVCGQEPADAEKFQNFRDKILDLFEEHLNSGND